MPCIPTLCVLRSTLTLMADEVRLVFDSLPVAGSTSCALRRAFSTLSLLRSDYYAKFLSNRILTRYVLRSTLYALRSTLYALHSTLYALHSTLYALRSTLYALHSTLYASNQLSDGSKDARNPSQHECFTYQTRPPQRTTVPRIS